MALTSKNLPPIQQASQGAVVNLGPDDPFPNIEAKPLNQPDFINIRPKNPVIEFRWVNSKAGFSSGQEGLRVDQMVFAGFTPAKPEDCLNLAPSFIGANGKIQHGDLVLMKIDKKIYQGALKYNWARSVGRLHPQADLQVGRSELRQAVNESGYGRYPNVNQKLSAFRPTAAEVEKLEAQEDSTKVPSNAAMPGTDPNTPTKPLNIPKKLD